MPLAVPNRDDFSLQDVIDAIAPQSNDFLQCIADSDSSLFDATYGAKATADNLLNFRNYGLGYDINLINILTRPYYDGSADPGWIIGKPSTTQQYYTSNYIRWEFQNINVAGTLIYFNAKNLRYGHYTSTSTIDWAIMDYDGSTVLRYGTAYASLTYLQNEVQISASISSAFTNPRYIIFVKESGTSTWYRIKSLFDSPLLKWVFDYSTSSYLYFKVHYLGDINSGKQYGTMDWQTRDSGGNVIQSGTFDEAPYGSSPSAMGVSYGESDANAKATHTRPGTFSNQSYATLWGRVMGGSWEELHAYSSSLSVSRHNMLKIAYICGSGYASTQEQIEVYIKKSSDNSVLFSYSAIRTFEANTRLRLLTIIGSQFNLVLSSQNLYFELIVTARFKSGNSNIVSQGNNRYTMGFSIVAGTTAVPTGSVSPSSLEFLYDGTPIGGGNFGITSSGEWVAICPDFLTLDKYHGTGNDTVNPSVIDHDIEGQIIIHKMNNEQFGLTVKVWAPGYFPDWLGFISWGFDYESGGTMYFVAYNGSSAPHAKDAQTSQMFWEGRDINDSVVDSGNVTALLDAGDASAPTDACYNWGQIVTIWGQVMGGNWIQLY